MFSAENSAVSSETVLIARDGITTNASLYIFLLLSFFRTADRIFKKYLKARLRFSPSVTSLPPFGVKCHQLALGSSGIEKSITALADKVNN